MNKINDLAWKERRIERFWLTVLVSSIVLLTLGAVVWISQHPTGWGWDEQMYFNEIYTDADAYEEGGFPYLFRVLFLRSRARPPALRMLAWPVSLTGALHPFSLRLLSWGYLLLSCGLIYLAGRDMAGPAAGMVAVLVLLASPVIAFSGKMFLTEAGLFLSLAGTLYFMLGTFRGKWGSRWRWIGLGVASGLGALAKVSYFFVAAPLYVLVGWATWQKRIAGPRPLDLVKAAGVALFISLPWWVGNYRIVLDFLFHTTAGFTRHALGAGLAWPVRMMLGIDVLVQTIFGPALITLVAMMVGLFFWQARKWDAQRRLQVGICLLATIPTVVLTFVGTNNNARYLAPALWPLALAVGVIAYQTGWLRRSVTRILMAGVVLGQIALMVTPSPGEARYKISDAPDHLLLGNLFTIFEVHEDWDWGGLRRLCRERAVSNPAIVYLGNGEVFNVPHIEFPWVQADEPVSVQRLYRQEDGEIAWDKMMAAAAASDVVVTALDYSADGPNQFALDNRYNQAFVDRLQQSSAFEGPVILPVGRFEKSRVMVFFPRLDVDTK